MTHLSLQGLSRFYAEVPVVDRLSLEIASGEFLSLLGSSGCGKTTTLRMIAGFITPSEGTITVGGNLLSSPARVVPPEGRGMSMIFQSYAIWPHKTVRQNIEFGLKLRRLSRAEIRQRCDEVLDLVRLGDLAERYPSALSGGQQQRVALARAIVVRPKVLLLDEPLSNLDATLREDMAREIRRLHDRLQLTTIYVTHDQTEAMRTSDRIAVMNGGRIEQISAPHEIYAKPATPFVAGFLGKTNLLPIRALDGGFVVETLPCHLAHAPFAVPNGKALALRPHDIHLHHDKPDRLSGEIITVTIAERAYLGGAWEYLVTPDAGGPTLTVTAGPRGLFAVGERVWAHLDLALGEVLKP